MVLLRLCGAATMLGLFLLVADCARGEWANRRQGLEAIGNFLFFSGIAMACLVVFMAALPIW